MAAALPPEMPPVPAETVDLKGAQKNYSSLAGQFLNQLGDGLNANPNAQDHIIKLRNLQNNIQPLPNNDETIAAMQTLAAMQKKQQEAASVPNEEIEKNQKALTDIMNKAKAEQETIRKGLADKANANAGHPTSLMIEQHGKYDIMINTETGRMQTQKAFFRKAAFDSLLNAASQQYKFTNIKFEPDIDNYLGEQGRATLGGTHYSPTRNKFVARRLEAIEKAIGKDMYPAHDIEKIFPYLDDKQREKLKTLKTDYESRRERYLAGDTKKAGVGTDISADETKKDSLTISPKADAAKPAADAATAKTETAKTPAADTSATMTPRPK